MLYIYMFCLNCFRRVHYIVICCAKRYFCASPPRRCYIIVSFSSQYRIDDMQFFRISVDFGSKNIRNLINIDAHFFGNDGRRCCQRAAASHKNIAYNYIYCIHVKC